MSFNSHRLAGIFAPIVTPFDSSERVMLEALRDNILWYNTTNLSGYMPLGSNGEFQGLTDQESTMILDTVCRYKAANKTVVGGCGRESAVNTLEAIRRNADHGLDLAFILPPHYFVSYITDEHLFRYYIRVADSSPIPIVIYNAPKFASGLFLSTSLIAELAGHPNIVGIKNSSLDDDSDYIKVSQGNIVLLAGNISKLLNALKHGAVGGVISTASYLPELCCKLYESFSSGNMCRAEELSVYLNSLSSKSIGPMGVPGVKLGMTLRGLIGGHVRCPLIDASKEQAAEVARLFKEYKISPAK